MSLLRARARFATSLVVCVGPREVNNLAAGAEKQSQAATPLIGIVRPPRPEVADSGRFTLYLVLRLCTTKACDSYVLLVRLGHAACRPVKHRALLRPPRPKLARLRPPRPELARLITEPLKCSPPSLPFGGFWLALRGPPPGLRFRGGGALSGSRSGPLSGRVRCPVGLSRKGAQCFLFFVFCGRASPLNHGSPRPEHGIYMLFLKF